MEEIKNETESTVAKKGRKRETAEQKEERRLKKLNKVVEENEIIFEQLKNLNSGIKKYIGNLTSKEVEKLKNNLNATIVLIDSTLEEKLIKEKEEKEKQVKKQISDLEAQLEALKKQL